MAGHLALIPKGPFRGHLLAWNWMRGITGKQHWSIIDPVNQTFQNFTLPMPPGEGELFCAGHAWTKDGDLFVAGGNLTGPGLVANDLADHQLVHGVVDGRDPLALGIADSLFAEVPVAPEP